MRAVVCRDLGEPETLVIEDHDPRPLGPGQVRLRVRACGVNYVDALFVQGRYQIKPPLPFVPGSEVAGEVIEVGSDVPSFGEDAWGVGDRAFASVGLGGYSSEVTVAASSLVRVPDALTDAQAATMGQSYATAWFALPRRTQLRADEWVVALGAAGGVGLAVIDVARALGARVLAAASDDGFNVLTKDLLLAAKLAKVQLPDELIAETPYAAVRLPMDPAELYATGRRGRIGWPNAVRWPAHARTRACDPDAPTLNCALNSLASTGPRRLRRTDQDCVETILRHAAASRAQRPRQLRRPAAAAAQS
jgi:D-arabinose 1-dehydrogenase-like Zn-dependent alcohol dehydrogenase